jgi:hypothetical protein
VVDGVAGDVSAHVASNIGEMGRSNKVSTGMYWANEELLMTVKPQGIIILVN